MAERAGEEAPETAAAPVLPAQVAAPQAVDIDEGATAAPGDAAGGEPAPVVLHSDVNAQRVMIDWWEQIMAGGWAMVPLLVLSVAGVVIGVLRFLTVRVNRIAPPGLEPAVRRAMASGDVARALAECDRHPSTLAEALRFVVEHRQNDVQVVNQGAGDIAARDIRDHMSRIYPLSVIASLAPLLGLLGTIIGMIEAFALVSIYGDEGGAPSCPAPSRRRRSPRPPASSSPFPRSPSTTSSRTA
jgi:biopolymer transport protein ExbB/TolQ